MILFAVTVIQNRYSWFEPSFFLNNYLSWKVIHKIMCMFPALWIRVTQDTYRRILAGRQMDRWVVSCIRTSNTAHKYRGSRRRNSHRDRRSTLDIHRGHWRLQWFATSPSSNTIATKLKNSSLTDETLNKMRKLIFIMKVSCNSQVFYLSDRRLNVLYTCTRIKSHIKKKN